MNGRVPSSLTRGQTPDVAPGATCVRPEADESTRCLRCSTRMNWIHSSWQCPACKFKEGCCG